MTHQSYGIRFTFFRKLPFFPPLHIICSDLSLLRGDLVRSFNHRVDSVVGINHSLQSCSSARRLVRSFLFSLLRVVLWWISSHVSPKKQSCWVKSKQIYFTRFCKWFLTGWGRLHVCFSVYLGMGIPGAPHPHRHLLLLIFAFFQSGPPLLIADRWIF